MNIADIVVILLIVFTTFIGSQRGLLLSIFMIASYFLSIFIAIKFAPVLSNVLDNTSLFASIKMSVSEFIDNIVTNTAGLAGEEISTQVDEIMNQLHLSGAIGNNLDISNIKDQAISTSAMVETLGEKIAEFILLAISFVILYVVIKIALFFVEEIIKKTGKLPVIRLFDKAGGIIFGAVEGVLVVWIISTVLFLFRSAEAFTGIFRAIDNSTIALYLYKHNIVLDFLSNLL